MDASPQVFHVGGYKRSVFLLTQWHSFPGSNVIHTKDFGRREELEARAKIVEIRLLAAETGSARQNAQGRRRTDLAPSF